VRADKVNRSPRRRDPSDAGKVLLLCAAQNNLDAWRGDIYLGFRSLNCALQRLRRNDGTRTTMSDAKPRRTARESGRSEIASGEIVPTQTAPIIAPVIAPEFAPEAAAAAPTAPEAASTRPVAASEPAMPVRAESVESEAAADDAWAAFTDMQAALARGFVEAALEVSAITRTGIAAAAAAATAMLGARTFAEAVEINAGLIRGRSDAMIAGSARLSEIGVKAVTEASRPILARFGAGGSGAAIV